MRTKYQKAPITTEWTLAPPTDTGDAIRMGMEIGAATALMDDAWWFPMILDPTSGDRIICLFERALPHSIIVDSSANRFTNESQSYIDVGHDIYRRHQDVSAIPAWMILDNNHRRKYPLGNLLPGFAPQSALDSYVYKGESLDELAGKIGLDPRPLNKTVQRFNDMARRGVDEDFGRGQTAYDLYFGDPKSTPNKALGPIERGSFYAVKVWPGDLGTKGGLLTDEYGRVIDQGGRPIRGLYAAGNTTASVMGRTYPGARFDFCLYRR